MTDSQPLRIQVNVNGSHTHYAPAERCIVTFRVSKEGDSQAGVVEAVTTLSNDLTVLFKSLCPKDSSSGKSTKDVNDPTVPVTTSSWIPYLPPKKDGTEAGPAPRRYRASTSFNVKFKDFKKMGQVCLDIAKNDDISISNLDWRLTDLTQNKLKLKVRQGAVLDAIDKAKGYCSTFSMTSSEKTITNWKCIPKEISDISSNNGNFGGGAPRAMMYAQRTIGGGGHGEGESLNFEPEDVSLNAGVDCKFDCYEKYD